MTSDAADGGADAGEPVPEQQELAPLDGGERLARVEELREVLERTGSFDPADEDSDGGD